MEFEYGIGEQKPRVRLITFTMEMEIPYVYAVFETEAGIGLKRFRPERARCFVICTVMICYTT